MTSPALERLRRTIPPPSRPVGVQGDWKEIERKLQLSLPDDYKEFTSVYGSGGFLPFELFVNNLLVRDVDADFIRSQTQFARDAENSAITLQQFHESIGVFPWGADGVGSDYFWAQEGSPQNWYVIVVEGGLKFFRFPDLTLTSFLVALFVDREARLTRLYADSGALDDQKFQPAPS